MKRYFKYSILTTLTILMIISSVKAAPIGTTTQPNPFESMPSTMAYYNVYGPTDKTKMNNGGLSDSGGFQLGGSTILNPNSDGFYSEWTASYLYWADWPANDGSTTERTGVSKATTGSRATSQLTDVPSDAAGTIASVKVWIVAKRSATTITMATMLRLGTTDLAGANIAVSTSAYTLYSQTYTTKPGGGSWLWTDLNGLEAGVKTGTTGAGTAYVTQLYVEVVNAGTVGYFKFGGFSTSPDPSFTSIGFVDIKMGYAVPSATVDDTYAIQYSTDGSTWTDLQSATTSIFDEGGAGAVKPWAQVAGPGVAGAWDWGAISSLQIRIIATQVGGSWDLKTMNVFEVWATVYSTPKPPISSTTVSVQPPAVMGPTPTKEFFVDVYVEDVTPHPETGKGLAGYEFTMSFDTNIVSFVEAWSYWPWTDVSVTPDEAAGLVSVVGTANPPTVDEGILGNSPMARVYFSVDQGGETALNLPISLLGAPGGRPFAHTVYGGFFSSPHYLSFTAGIFPGGDPTGTTWHEDYPTFSTTWTVAGWTDNGDDTLSPSDQLTIDVGGILMDYHVDQITITIHWTFKPTGEGAADPEDPTTPPDLGMDPTGSRWHQIYPDYCRYFTITGWIDNGGGPDGVFDPSDQFQITYDDDGSTADAHLDSVTTNILVSQKPGIAPVPEFPMGLGIMMAIAPAIAIAYLWRTRRKVTKP